jgi:tRNA U34 5-methylaminomethyl-2-thiouridine-forming methyltransferase MnmC
LNQLVTTSDGSHTIFVPELNEHFHSIHGAVQESMIVFIQNGFEYCKADPINILEIGFGTGLNTLLTAVQCMNTNRKAIYTSVEKYPLAENLIQTLNHWSFAGDQGRQIFDLIHNSKWGVFKKLTEYFWLKKIKCDLVRDSIEGKFDLVFFDAFGPDKQPEMWTSDVFMKIADVTDTNSVLVTYSAKGEVKRILKACGFNISLLPGPPGKRHVIRAIRQ